MAVAIRLSRGGAKKRPYYRIVVSDSRSARDGKYLEQIGTYNPMLPKDSGERVKLNEDRARHWLSVGAQPSDRVHRFLDAAGILERAARNNPKKGEPGSHSEYTWPVRCPRQRKDTRKRHGKQLLVRKDNQRNTKKRSSKYKSLNKLP